MDEIPKVQRSSDAKVTQIGQFKIATLYEESNTYRLKGPGMRWDKEGAEPMLALLALEQSNARESYWQSQYRASQPCQKT